MTEFQVEAGDVNGVRTIVLDRPARANALTLEMMRALRAELAGQNGGRNGGATLIRSSGDDFCNGVDLDLVARDPLTSAELFLDLLQDAAAAVFPLVAAVRGRVNGGGWLLAACADLVVAHPAATFGLPELRIGFPPLSAVSLLHAKLGESLWCRAVAVGEPIDAATLARATGLIVSDTPEDAGRAFAATLARADAAAFAATKAFARRAMLADLARARAESTAYLGRLQGGQIAPASRSAAMSASV